MKRSFAMSIDLGFEKPGADGSGGELRREMEAIEEAVRAVVIARAGKAQTASVYVRVTHGESRDV